MSGLVGGSSSKNLRVKEFRSSGTFTVPVGVKTVELFLVGGGAGGATNYSGVPGQVLQTKYDVDGKSACAVVIGAGGTESVNGGDSSFDSVVTAVGGKSRVSVNTNTDYGYLGYPVGVFGFGGAGGAGNVKAIPVNGAGMNASGAANSGAGGGGANAGGSGYCRVEWYE